jgi:hypothetical protein
MVVEVSMSATAGNANLIVLTVSDHPAVEKSLIIQP